MIENTATTPIGRCAATIFALALALALASTGCGDDGGDHGLGGPVGDYFPTTSVVFGQESIGTYLSLLRSIDPQDIDYEAAREFAGWADLWVHGDKAFVTDGEATAQVEVTN